MDQRLTRYAAFAAVHGAIVLAAIGGIGAPYAWGAAFLSAVPLFFAWGAFHADVALNADLDDVDRTRWRVGLTLLPWSMTAYWYLYVRPRRD